MLAEVSTTALRFLPPGFRHVIIPGAAHGFAYLDRVVDLGSTGWGGICRGSPIESRPDNLLPDLSSHLFLQGIYTGTRVSFPGVCAFGPRNCFCRELQSFVPLLPG